MTLPGRLARGHSALPGHLGKADLAGGVYGTILVTSLIAAFTEKQTAGTGEILVSVAGVVLVLWIAHVFSGALANVARHGHGSRQAAAAAIRHEWPLIEAVAVPCLALGLGAVGPVPEEFAFGLALALGVLSMAAWGVIVGRELGLSWPRTAGTAALSTALGVGIVALKLIID